MVSATVFKSISCPVCGQAMAEGYIAGQWTRLRWVDKPNTKTIFAGKPLRREINWWSAPNVEALRCEDCKIGVFRYDN